MMFKLVTSIYDDQQNWMHVTVYCCIHLLCIYYYCVADGGIVFQSCAYSGKH